MKHTDYEPWGGLKGTLSSPQEIASVMQELPGCVEIETSHGVPIPLCAPRLSNSDKSPLLIFFNGAVSNRESKTGPFFSGRGISDRLGVDAVLVADPILDDEPELSIGWYAGSAECPTLLDDIANVLSTLAMELGRHLVLVGGSAGGFAALAIGARLGRLATVLAWNPQTDLLRYNPESTRAYLASAWRMSDLTSPGWYERASQVIRQAGGQHSVVEAGRKPARSLVVQNASDWHVRSHFGPYLDARKMTDRGGGVFVADENHVASIGNWGAGHVAPPVRDIESALTLLLRNDSSMLEVQARAFALPWADDESCIADMRGLGDEVFRALEPTVSFTASSAVVGFSTDSIPFRYGGMNINIDVVSLEGKPMATGNAWRGSTCVVALHELARDVRVTCVDAFGHEIGARRYPVPLEMRGSAALSGGL